MLSEQEFIAALREHAAILHKVCKVYQQDESLREDLYQEIICNAWKGIVSFRGDARFSTWLYRVALNTAITFYRKTQQQPAYQALNEAAEQLADVSEETAHQILYQAINHLSDIDKALVMLYLDEYDYNEISDMLGITPNHIAVRMSRIRDKLKKIVANYQILE